MKPLAALLFLVGISSATEAKAQQYARCGNCGSYHPVATSTASGSGSYSSSYGQATSSAPLYPYSYYVAMPGNARGYVGYGSNDFPFYGVPYGHPYDPWTWPYMAGTYYSRGLARYYDPPVK